MHYAKKHVVENTITLTGTCSDFCHMYDAFLINAYPRKRPRPPRPRHPRPMACISLKPISTSYQELFKKKKKILKLSQLFQNIRNSNGKFKNNWGPYTLTC